MTKSVSLPSEPCYSLELADTDTEYFFEFFSEHFNISSAVPEWREETLRTFIGWWFVPRNDLNTIKMKLLADALVTLYQKKRRLPNFCFHGLAYGVTSPYAFSGHKGEVVAKLCSA